MGSRKIILFLINFEAQYNPLVNIFFTSFIITMTESPCT